MSSRLLFLVAATTALTLSVARCSGEAPAAPDAASAFQLDRETLPEGVAEQLIALRQSLIKYESLDAAKADGFDTDLTGCMEMRPAGGMGHHFAKLAILDGTPDETAPEALLYQPGPGGTMKLVAVEFIVPFTAWSADTPPVLFGQTMRYNATFNVWALHAWLFQANPKGVFADYNPTVHC